MELGDSNSHSFIVKVWLEETAEEAGRAIWRGHITHVSREENRRYVKDLDELAAFIVHYLEGMGVKFGMRWRLRRCLTCLRLLFIR